MATIFFAEVQLWKILNIRTEGNGMWNYLGNINALIRMGCTSECETS